MAYPFLLHRHVEITPFWKISPIACKASELQLLYPDWRLTDGSLVQLGWGDVFPFICRVEENFQLPSHNLDLDTVDRGVTSAVPTRLLGRVGCTPRASIVPHPSSPE